LIKSRVEFVGPLGPQIEIVDERVSTSVLIDRARKNDPTVLDRIIEHIARPDTERLPDGVRIRGLRLSSEAAVDHESIGKETPYLRQPVPQSSRAADTQSCYARFLFAKERAMPILPPEPLIPGGSLLTPTAEEGRALAITMARHSIHAMQKDIIRCTRAATAMHMMSAS